MARFNIFRYFIISKNSKEYLIFLIVLYYTLLLYHIIYVNTLQFRSKVPRKSPSSEQTSKDGVRPPWTILAPSYSRTAHLENRPSVVRPNLRTAVLVQEGLTRNFIMKTANFGLKFCKKYLFFETNDFHSEQFRF